jgi:hypothetical protein
MKLGVVITMFDEFEIVLSSVQNIKNVFPDSIIVIVKSNCDLNSNNLEKLTNLSDKFIVLDNLSSLYNRFELPSQAICRNISKGCDELYKMGEFDLITILTGDTFIKDAESLKRRYDDILINDWYAMVSIAIGQNFHSNDDDPINGKSGGRVQNENTTDFACCFFILKGDFFKKHLAFTNIKITNRFTSEQCLGDEMKRILTIQNLDFKDKVGILNYNSPRVAYSYDDGISYHYKTNGSPSR